VADTRRFEKFPRRNSFKNFFLFLFRENRGVNTGVVVDGATEHPPWNVSLGTE
jgi:hypothetical protein